MAVSYQGKKPGKLWYFQKRCGAILKTFRDKDTKASAQIMAGDAGVTALWVAGGIAVLSVPQLALVPFLVPVAAGVAGFGGLVYGVKSWLNLRGLNKSTPVYFYMKDAEESWLRKKQRAPLLTRINASIKNGLTKTSNALLSPLQIFKRKPKALPPVTTQPTAPAPAAATAQPALDNSFKTAATTPAVKTAQELADEQGRLARAAARAARKANPGQNF